MGETESQERDDDGLYLGFSAMDLLHEGILVQDATGRVLFSNEAVRRILRLTEAELTDLRALRERFGAFREDGSPFPTDELPSARCFRTGEPQDPVVIGFFHPSDPERLWIRGGARGLFRAGASTPYAVVLSLTDITELKRVEAGLRRSEARYRKIVELAFEGVWMIDAEARTTYVNRRVAEMLAFTPEEIIGKPVSHFVSPKHEQAVKQALARRRKGVEEQYELHFLRADGSEINALLAATPVFEDGAYAGSLAMITDMTERVRTEAALRESEARLACTEAFSLVMTTHVGLDGRLLKVPPTYCDMLGYTETELLSLTLQDITHPDDIETDAAQRERVVRGEIKSFDLEKRYIGKSGAIVWVYVNRSAVLDAEGRPLYFLTYLRDITEHKRDETLRAAQSVTLQLLAEGAPLDDVLIKLTKQFEQHCGGLCSVMLVDGDGKRLRSIAGASLPAEYSRAIDGIAIGENVGSCGTAAFRRERVIVEDVGTDPLWAGYQEYAIRYGLRACWSEPVFSATGELLGTLALYYPRPYRPDAHGLKLLEGAAHVVSIAIERARAEAARVRLEEELRQAQKMEALGRIAGSVAHDFNNFLLIINIYAELLKQAAAPGDKVHEYASTILDTGQSAAALTKQLLAFTRRQPWTPRVMDLNEPVAELSSILRRALRDEIEQELDLASGLWPIKADRVQVQQVLMNLAVNAGDAIHGPGKLVIRTENVELTADAPDLPPTLGRGRYVKLTVRDTGSGMTEEVKRKAFEPFFTTKEKGTGLGLPVVYGNVTAMGGHVQVMSRLGEGTTFEIFVPAVTEAAVASSEALGPALPRGRERVLLVEDEAAIRGALAEHLRALGYDVISVDGGPSALEVLKREGGRVRAVLTDIVMPGMRGDELGREVRRQHPATALVFMSGYAEKLEGREGSERMGVRFLQKPFRQADLARALREALDEAERVTAHEKAISALPM